MSKSNLTAPLLAEHAAATASSSSSSSNTNSRERPAQTIEFLDIANERRSVAETNVTRSYYGDDGAADPGRTFNPAQASQRAPG